MERSEAGLIPLDQEVLVLEGEVVASIRALAARGVGSKRIAATVGVARNTVKRYLRRPVPAGQQERPRARKLSAAVRARARALYAGEAEGNAVVVHRLLCEQGAAVSVRTVERAVADLRRAQRVAEVATVRVETAPGEQVQIDFGQKRVAIAGAPVRVHVLVAVLSYSRRLFVQAFLHERQEAWRAGILAQGEHASGEVVELISKEFGITQSAVSQQLRVLRESGFVTVRADGARRLYSVDARPLADVDVWLGQFRRLWGAPLEALATEIARGKRARRPAR